MAQVARPEETRDGIMGEMHRTVLVLPGLLAPEGSESVLQKFESELFPIVSRSRLTRLIPTEDAAVPEAAWVGLDPSVVPLADGPLTLSALHADPPERSVQFHLSLLSCNGWGVAEAPRFSAPEPEMDSLMREAEKLSTSSMTMVKGRDFDHGLVWDKGSLDLHTHEALEVQGKPISRFLPEGDGESALRRFIDDSVNLLTPLELNRRRLDEGLPALNLLWPWGQGIVHAMPNLALKRGIPAVFASNSMRLQGLCRFVRYRHLDRAVFEGRHEEVVRKLHEWSGAEPLSVVVLGAIDSFLGQGSLESATKWMGSIVSVFMEPLKSDKLRVREFVMLVPASSTIPDSPDGLALHWTSETREEHSIPFDERAVEDRRLQRRTVWEIMDEALRG